MKRALCLFTFAAALSAGTLAASPLPATPACPAAPTTDTAAAAQLPLQLPIVAFAAAQCPRPGLNCPDVYNPVICSNGVVYSNSCYAYVACATGCVSYGDTI